MFNFVSGIILSKLFHFVIFLSYFCSHVSHCFVMVYFIFVTVFFLYPTLPVFTFSTYS